jgi:N-acetylglucosaminyldiphosphoundecaprenol N-acetyl-beta-D-mannosaminyltransferase
MIDKGKWPVLGVNVDAVDYEVAVERTVAAAKQKKSFIVTALPVHGIMTGVRDARHRYRLNRFDLLVPDGQPVRWALNLLFRTRLRDRVYGPNLMLRLCERLAREGLPIFLFGSRTETLEKLRANLIGRYPTLIVSGTRQGEYRRVTPTERAEIADQIKSSGAALTFVGLGCPRQEIWAYENSSDLKMPLVCVGAAFDFHAGTAVQASEPLQAAGLEWAFRLFKEPKRLWRRYLFLNPLYIAMIAAQAAGITDFVKESNPPTEDTNLS